MNHPTSDYDAKGTRALVSCRQAVMASQSSSIPGFPLTSVIPVAVVDNHIIMLLSDLAQHTRNIDMDNRVSLMMHDDQEQNWQAAHRLSIMGYVEPIDHELHNMDKIRKNYFRIHPELNDFDQHMDFRFWLLRPMRFRLIAGFGQVRWLEQINCQLFDLDEEDHQKVNTILIEHRTAVSQLLQASKYGLQIIESGRVIFLSFRQPVKSVAGLLVQLSTGAYNTVTETR
jgi:putative heme iron utilization protein